MSLIYPNKDYISQQRSQANYILDNYRFEKSIGQGTFGKVKLALFLPSNKKYAVKILNKTQIKLKKETHLVKRELDIIPKFAHPNVIHVKCIFEDESNYYIIMDYCENGELFDYIVKHHSLTEDETALFFYQLINGVEHIHSKHVVHRDLKPENLLLTKTNMLKIIDFGLSNHFSGNESNIIFFVPVTHKFCTPFFNHMEDAFRVSAAR
jgi:serine/threonine protein kinase